MSGQDQGASIAREVMADFLGLDPTEVHPESRGAQLIREGIRRFIAQTTTHTQGSPDHDDE